MRPTSAGKAPAKKAPGLVKGKPTQAQARATRGRGLDEGRTAQRYGPGPGSRPGRAASRGGAAKLQAKAPNRGRRAPSAYRGGKPIVNLSGVNLNPLNRVRIPDIGQAVSNLLQDRVIGNPGAKIKRAVGQK